MQVPIRAGGSIMKTSFHFSFKTARAPEKTRRTASPGQGLHLSSKTGSNEGTCIPFPAAGAGKPEIIRGRVEPGRLIFLPGVREEESGIGRPRPAAEKTGLLVFWVFCVFILSPILLIVPSIKRLSDEDSESPDDSESAGKNGPLQSA